MITVRNKSRVDRKFGANIWGRSNSPIIKRNYRLGQHGKRVRRQASNHSVQLNSRQLIRTFYNLSEKQFRNTFIKVSRGPKTQIALAFLTKLECRLDQIVYKLRFAPTIFSARQLVSHKHILVDDKTVNIPSFEVKPGQVISVRSQSRQITMIDMNTDKSTNEVPPYLKLKDKFSGTLVKLPESRKEIKFPFDNNIDDHVVRIVETYSKIV
jgi:small subunit ribosomal protein S4